MTYKEFLEEPTIDQFKPLPQSALQRLVQARNYILDGKYGQYSIDYYDTVDDDDEDRGAITLTLQDGSEVIFVRPENITFMGGWIRIVDEDGGVYNFTLEKRLTIWCECIAQELFN